MTAYGLVALDNKNHDASELPGAAPHIFLQWETGLPGSRYAQNFRETHDTKCNLGLDAENGALKLTAWIFGSYSMLFTQVNI